jgi:hypothetical protein
MTQTPTFLYSDNGTSNADLTIGENQNFRESIRENFLGQNSEENSNPLQTSTSRYYVPRILKYCELEWSSGIFEEMDTFLSRNNCLKTYSKKNPKILVFNSYLQDPMHNTDMPIEEATEGEEESQYLSNSMLTKNIELITCPGNVDSGVDRNSDEPPLGTTDRILEPDGRWDSNFGKNLLAIGLEGEGDEDFESVRRNIFTELGDQMLLNTKATNEFLKTLGDIEDSDAKSDHEFSSRKSVPRIMEIDDKREVFGCSDEEFSPKPAKDQNFKIKKSAKIVEVDPGFAAENQISECDQSEINLYKTTSANKGYSSKNCGYDDSRTYQLESHEKIFQTCDQKIDSNIHSNFETIKPKSASHGTPEQEPESPGGNNSSLFDIIKKDVDRIEKKIEKMDNNHVSNHKDYNTKAETCLDINSYKKKMMDEDTQMIKRINETNGCAVDGSLYDIIQKGMHIVENKIESLDEQFLSQSKGQGFCGPDQHGNFSNKRSANSGPNDDYNINPKSLTDNFNEVKNSLKNSLKKSARGLSDSLKVQSTEKPQNPYPTKPDSTQNPDFNLNINLNLKESLSKIDDNFDGFQLTNVNSTNPNQQTPRNPLTTYNTNTINYSSTQYVDHTETNYYDSVFTTHNPDPNPLNSGHKNSSNSEKKLINAFNRVDDPSPRNSSEPIKNTNSDENSLYDLIIQKGCNLIEERLEKIPKGG